MRTKTGGLKMSVNREKFDNALNNFKDDIEKMLRSLNNANNMFIFDDMRILSKDADVCIKNIKNYVTQLEEELKKCKKEPQIKQVVSRSHANGDTNYLSQYLNEGYRIVMANHIGEHGSIEYVLEKEVMEDVD